MNYFQVYARALKCQIPRLHKKHKRPFQKKRKGRKQRTLNLRYECGYECRLRQQRFLQKAEDKNHQPFLV